MTNSEADVNPNNKQKPDGDAGAFASNIPTGDDAEPGRKTGAHTTYLQDDQDPKLLHYLDGHLIIRHSHTPFASGGFCDVFTGHHQRYGKVAMRRPRMTEKGYKLSEMTDFLAESEIWKKLRHPNILQFLGLIQSDGYIWAVSDFADNGSLKVYLEDHPGIDRRALVFQLADAVAYLHLQSVVHGDIKGSNILVSAAGTVLLSDFGLSKLSGTPTRTSLSGAVSIRWCAPEVLLEGVPKSVASDVYSFGMTAYEILSGNVPFHTIPNDVVVIIAINKGDRPLREPATSKSENLDELWDVVADCWDHSHSNWPTMKNVCERFGGPLNLPSDIAAEGIPGTVDEISANTADKEPMTRGIGYLDGRFMDVLPAGQVSSTRTVEFIDDPIQKIPRARAQYDSSLRRGARRCLQGTRTGLVQMIHGWIDKGAPGKGSIFWLSGEAGTGKSTIAHTIAEDRGKQHQLGASFFFSRNEEARRDANLFVSTLAFQLSVFDKKFKAHLAASLNRDPTLPEKKIKSQLYKMVVEPLRNSKSLATDPIVIVVDALDECSPDAGAEEILDALVDLIQEFPSRFRLFITSRPSWHIKSKIESVKHLFTVFRLRDISEIVVKSDVELYLRESLADVLDGGIAPGDLELLVERVGLLFVLGSTYVKYIKDPTRNPRRQLQALLSRKPTLGVSPVDELDTLYLDIVQDVPQGSNSKAIVNAFEKVVGAMVVSGNPMTPIQLSSFLDMDQEDVFYVLRRLSSVVSLPDNLADETTPMSFFHQSFSEFLTDPDRCTDRLYAVDKSEAHKRMANLCLDIFDKHFGRVDLSTAAFYFQPDPYIPGFPSQDDDIPDFPLPNQTSSKSDGQDDPPITKALEDSETLEPLPHTPSKFYPAHLCYACVYFDYHLNAIPPESTSALTRRFRRFYFFQKHRWLEVVESLGGTAGVNDLARKLHKGIEKYDQNASFVDLCASYSGPVAAPVSLSSLSLYSRSRASSAASSASRKFNR